MTMFVRSLLASLAIGAACAHALTDPRKESPRPDFGAPAAELLGAVFTNPDFDHGPRAKEYMKALEEQVVQRPVEFAAALAPALPDGYRALRALNENDEAFIKSLKAMQALPHFARWMPPEIAAPTLSALQRKAAMIEWHLLQKHDDATDGRLRAGKRTAKDEADHQVLQLLGFRYFKVRAAVESVAQELRLDISPTIKPWPGEPTDLDKRNLLIAVCNDRFDADSGAPIGLSLEEFFEGNTQHTSIAPNLWFNHPGIECFRHTLESIRQRPEVLDVRVSVHEWPEPGEPQWISAESVFIWTRDAADADAVSEWVAVLRPDSVGECPVESIPTGGPELDAQSKVIGIYWD